MIPLQVVLYQPVVLERLLRSHQNHMCYDVHLCRQCPLHCHLFLASEGDNTESKSHRRFCRLQFDNEVPCLDGFSIVTACIGQKARLLRKYRLCRAVFCNVSHEREVRSWSVSRYGVTVFDEVRWPLA